MTSRYQDRKVAGTCTRCGEPAEDGYQLCTKHRAAQKRYATASYEASRDARKKARTCSRCGGKRKPGSKWCVACLIKRAKVKTQGLKQGQNNGRDRIAARTDAITEGDGRTRERYRGKQTTGRMSREALDAQDLELAARAVQRCRDGLAVAHGPEVAALPPIQRREALHAALSFAHLASRHLDDLLARNKYERPETANLND